MADKPIEPQLTATNNPQPSEYKTKLQTKEEQEAAKMSDVDTMLAQCFRGMAIEKKAADASNVKPANHHTLSFSYPDMDLLQPCDKLLLHPPAKLELRSRPPNDCRELALYDTDFSMALPLMKYYAPASKPVESYMRLLQAIEVAREQPGTTVMGVARVHQEIWDEIGYRVRVKRLGQGPFSLHQDFELSEVEWATLLSYAELRSYLGVLEHLVERASAKAYYHVRQRILASYGAGQVQHEEDSWTSTWGSKPSVCVTDLFFRRMPMLPDNIFAETMPHFMLPCGHGYHLDSWAALQVKGNVATGECCKECGKRIMQPEDDEYLSSMDKKTKTHRYMMMQRVWAHLVQGAPDLAAPRRLHFMSIFRVLGAALESMRPPDSVAPAEICPSRFEETREVLYHLEDFYCGWDQTISRTAEGILVELEAEAAKVEFGGVKLSERVNPPGWDDFLTRWLRRTAYFLCYRRCDGRDGEKCDGLHTHRDGMWYAPRSWERTESERFEKGAEANAGCLDMDAIIKSLDGIKFQ